MASRAAVSFSTLSRLYRHAEAKIALLSRCRPSNAREEQQQLEAAWRSGQRRLPRWNYRPVPDFGGLLQAIERALEQLEVQECLARLYAERGQELLAELKLVRALGEPAFVALAQQRYGAFADCWQRAADRLAKEWACTPPDDANEPRVASDASHDARSLYRAMSATVGRLRLPVRVRLSDDLEATAATGDGIIVIRRGRALTLSQTQRIVVHEVYGHALPRVRAEGERLGLFAAASAGGNDQQEGYALHLERAAGLLDAGRRFELALRHWAARSLERGADWVETTERCLELGAGLEQAVAVASRVHRGGGLGRERVYLPALCRVETALQEQPGLEDWLARGRLSVEAIRALGLCHAAHGESSSSEVST